MNAARDRHPGIEAAIAAAGGTQRKLAEKLGMAQATINRWKKIPPHHVARIEQLLKIPRHELRPDLYPAAREFGEDPQRRRRKK